jgi:MerR family transcriptional regulator, light-induced transcriptional regulator
MEDKSLPIREISRLTGINSVTLRAWERRYGLIKPLRTSKGHRLYSPGDVELIRKIQQWLARGLAIGKISELLESGASESAMEEGDSWQELKQHLLDLLADFNPNKIDHFFGAIFSEYPPALIADYLIAPTLVSLEQPAFGNGIKKNLLEYRLMEMALSFSHRQRQQGQGKSVAIVQLAGDVDKLRNALLHYGLIMNQMRSEQLGLVLPDELILAAGQLRLDAIIVFNDSTSSLAEFNRQLIHLAEKIPLPIIVGGFLGLPMLHGLPSHVHLAPEPGLQIMMQLLEQHLILSADIAPDTDPESAGD